MTTGDRLFGGVLALAAPLGLVLLGLALAPTASAQAPDLSPEPYHSYEEMKQDMQQLADQHDVATFRVLGESAQGQEIFAVDVALDVEERSEDELAELPTLYVDGAHHGNEILSAEASYYFLTRVLENATQDPATIGEKRLLVNPIVNPDGYTLDQRENTNGVDLNRNYPFHWGLYGTSDQPFSGNYRGDEAASEAETQVNMATMEELNLYAYLTGHTGTYDLVIPWNQDEDGQIPDWPAYEAWLTNIEDETGLSYRDPSGAGEAHAWAYGELGALGLLPEVDEEQTMPASAEEVEARLDEVLGVYELTWDNLTHLAGELHLETVNGTTVTVLNDGWGPAYNLTPIPADAAVDAPGNATGEDAPANATRTVPAGETLTLTMPEGTEAISYERVTIPTEQDAKLATLTMPAPLNASDEPTSEGGFLSTPAPLAGALTAIALLASTLHRRPRR